MLWTDQEEEFWRKRDFVQLYGALSQHKKLTVAQLICVTFKVACRRALMKCRNWVSVKCKKQTHFEDHQKDTVHKINLPCNIFLTSSVSNFRSDCAVFWQHFSRFREPQIWNALIWNSNTKTGHLQSSFRPLTVKFANDRLIKKDSFLEYLQ